ncbi:MAG: 30S ribosomal protein S6 [Patescibacteria group bacterium]
MDTEENKKNYEISFLLKEEADLKAFLETLKQYEAEISFEGPVKKITLAYEIQKQTSALFGYVRFTAPADQIPELNHTLTLRGPALRFLIVNFVPGQLPSSQVSTSQMVVSEPATSVLVSQSEPVVSVTHALPLSNEDLEKKIEEILK